MQSSTVQSDTPPVRKKPPRLEWLDMLRALCAVLIAALHWLRVALHLNLVQNDLVTPRFRNILASLKMNGMGWEMFENFPSRFLLQSANTPIAWLDNVIGLIFFNGWQAVDVFILMSGFSLALSQPGDAPVDSPAYWLKWYRDRLRRIVLPFWLVAIPINLLFMLVHQYAQRNPQALGAVSAAMDTLVSAGWPRIWMSTLLLIDPIGFDGSGHFLFSAWWFLTAITAAYLAYPILHWALRRFGGTGFLGIALVISLVSYAFVVRGMFGLRENTLYHILLFELFDFCFGMFLGDLYRNAETRQKVEQILNRPTVLVAAAIAVLIGEFAAYFNTLYPISAPLYTVGLFVLGRAVSLWLLRIPVVNRLGKLDSYMFYLCHQPIAYVVGVIMARLFGVYALSLGLLVFLFVTSVATIVYSNVFQWLSKPRKTVTSDSVAATSTQ